MTEKIILHINILKKEVLMKASFFFTVGSLHDMIEV